MALHAKVRRVLGIVLLGTAFFVTLSTIIAFGNLGALEVALLFLASALLVVSGWKLWDSGRLTQPH
jgi:hypothetical protein